MFIFVLKLTLTPVLLGLVSLAGRRWGPTISGWLIGLPLTSGPITLFLVISSGTTFGTATAIGTLAGTIAEIAFCLTYGRLALRYGWRITLAASWIAYFVLVAVLQSVTIPLLPLFGLIMLSLLGGVRLMTHQFTGKNATAPKLPGWDIPLRMVVATSFIVIVTGIAPFIGPRLTGLLAPFPLFGSVLAVFAHRLESPQAAYNVLKGMMLGLFTFASFFFVLALLLEPIGAPLAFLAAIITALLVQGFSLWVLQKRPKPSVA